MNDYFTSAVEVHPSTLFPPLPLPPLLPRQFEFSGNCTRSPPNYIYAGFAPYGVCNNHIKWTSCSGGWLLLSLSATLLSVIRLSCSGLPAVTAFLPVSAAFCWSLPSSLLTGLSLRVLLDSLPDRDRVLISLRIFQMLRTLLARLIAHQLFLFTSWICCN